MHLTRFEKLGLFLGNLLDEYGAFLIALAEVLFKCVVAAVVIIGAIMGVGCLSILIVAAMAFTIVSFWGWYVIPFVPLVHGFTLPWVDVFGLLLFYDLLQFYFQKQGKTPDLKKLLIQFIDKLLGILTLLVIGWAGTFYLP
jgi:hypothetical protein